MNITIGDILIYVTCFFGLFTSFYFLIILLDNKNDMKDKKNKKLPMVTVVVPAYNEEKTLAATLDSLINLDYPNDKYEVIIVDDGSKDKTWKIASEYAKTHKNIRAFHTKNGGKGRALNFAIKKAKGEFVGALDADSFVDSKALKAIVSRFDDPNTMSVTPAMKVFKANNFFRWIQEVEYIMGIFLRKVFAFVGSIHVTPGPFSFFRKSFFEKYGGYDEENLTEDIEVALRIQSHGYHIDNTVHALVYTVAPADFWTLFKQRLRWYYGFILNIEKYKHLFHPKNGNLGIIIMPAAFISIFMVVLSLGYTISKLFESFMNFITDFWSLGFDYFQLWNWKIDWFMMSNDLTFLAIITTILSVFIIYLANKMSTKNQYLALRFVLFSSVYWFFFGLWWIFAFLTRITGKKLKWGHRSL